MNGDIEDSEYCPVCYDVYEESGDQVPRILPCSHTLCHKCIGELLQGYSLECPQDRRIHLAPGGEKSFPQNKYILKHLQNQNDRKGIDTQFEICYKHRRELGFYCKEVNCKKVVCSACMAECHMNHNVVNILLEQKSMIEKYVTENDANVLMEEKAKLLTCIESTERELKSYNDKLVLHKQLVEHEWRKNVAKLTYRKDAVMNTLDERIVVAKENLIILDGIKKTTNENTTQNDIDIQIKTIESIKDDLREPETTELHKTFEPLFDLPKEFNFIQINKHTGAVSHSFPMDYNSVDSMQILSNGNAVVIGQCGELSRLTQYDTKDGRVLYSETLRPSPDSSCETARGLAEVTTGGKSYLAVSYWDDTKLDSGQHVKGWIHFYDNPNLYKLAFGYTEENLFPGRMCTGKTRDSFLCVNYPNGIKCVQLGSSPEADDTNFSGFKYSVCDIIPYSVCDMCCSKGTQGSLLIVGSGNLSAYNISNWRREWCVSGAIGDMENEMYIGGVTTDDRGTLYVCDWANSCVYKFSTEGVFLGSVLKAGESGFGKPCRLRWCRATSSLFIAHKKEGQFYIGVCKIHDFCTNQHM